MAIGIVYYTCVGVMRGVTTCYYLVVLLELSDVDLLCQNPRQTFTCFVTNNSRRGLRSELRDNQGLVVDN